jgi:hypothetical protein
LCHVQRRSSRRRTRTEHRSGSGVVAKIGTTWSHHVRKPSPLLGTANRQRSPARGKVLDIMAGSPAVGSADVLREALQCVEGLGTIRVVSAWRRHRHPFGGSWGGQSSLYAAIASDRRSLHGPAIPHRHRTRWSSDGRRSSRQWLIPILCLIGLSWSSRGHCASMGSTVNVSYQGTVLISSLT